MDFSGGVFSSSWLRDADKDAGTDVTADVDADANADETNDQSFRDRENLPCSNVQCSMFKDIADWAFLEGGMGFERGKRRRDGGEEF